MGERLPRSFYRREAETVARELLGCHLVRRDPDDGRRLAGRIVEAEAYLGIEDKAAHTHGGHRSERVESMWGEGGHAYVYFTYGMHHCLNVVAGADGDPVAVLVRALEPIEGLDAMYGRRAAARRDTDLCSGPAKLCEALAVDRELDGEDLVGGERLWVERSADRDAGEGREAEQRILSGPRIGIDYAEEWRQRPLRFWLEGNPHVSR